MDLEMRKRFNAAFTKEKYQEYLQKIENLHPGALDFRNAETPIFVPKLFTQKMLQACEDIIDIIVQPDFKSYTNRAIPDQLRVPNENGHSHFIAFDFGICESESGELEPQLIEMQGFPSLFAFQTFHSAITREYAQVPEGWSPYLSGYDETSHNQLLRDIIVGDAKPEEVVLMEIYPDQQKTRIDFYCSEQLLGVKTICYTQLKAEGTRMYYEVDGKQVTIKRIYNRLIFDDLMKQQNLGPVIDLSKHYDVEWIPHPNWFYRISKFTLPFISSPYVPPTYFLNELKQLPEDLSRFVLKPLFSFAGMGVIIDVEQKDIDNIPDPENWILQKKVNYADIIETPDIPAKAEIRLFYYWKDGWNRPVAVHNLSRLSKGKMIGTRYNKDKEWVGGSVAFFETAI